jgi:hypothetical protein
MMGLWDWIGWDWMGLEMELNVHSGLGDRYWAVHVYSTCTIIHSMHFSLYPQRGCCLSFAAELADDDDDDYDGSDVSEHSYIYILIATFTSLFYIHILR